MTKSEAIAFLEKYSRRNHYCEWATVGPSHGDPGGYPVIVKACSAIRHNSYSVEAVDNSKCDCPAKAHNAKVDEAVLILTHHDKP